MASPVIDIEAGIILGEIGITSVAEDTFDKVEVRDEGPRGEKSALKRFFIKEARDGGRDNGA